LLVLLLCLLTLLPLVGLLVGVVSHNSTVRYAALPMALQLDLSYRLFGPALFTPESALAPTPSSSGLLVTILMWAVIAVAIWALVRCVWSSRRNI
jgi:hypothetical protein